MNRFERHPKKTLLAIFLLSFLVIDLFCGLFFIPARKNSFRIPHPYYHHGLRANVETTASWREYDYPFFTNSLGFRDRAARVVPPKPTGPRERILLMGDSFMEGVGVPYEDTFAGMLAARLAPRAEVLNAAVVSYSPMLYYLKTRHLIETKGVTFDRLVVFIDMSDIQNEISYESYVPASFQTSQKLYFHIKRFLTDISYTLHRVDRILERRKDPLELGLHGDGLFPCFDDADLELLGDIDFHKSISEWTIKPQIFEKYGRRGLELAIANMQKLVDLCREHGIRVAIAVYPWPDQIGTRDLESIQVKQWRRFCKWNGLPFLNYFPDFIDTRTPKEVFDRYFIPGDVHWNRAGHQIIADRLIDFFLGGPSAGSRARNRP